MLFMAPVSTLTFGAGIWTAFAPGVSEASGFLEKRAYPLHRMVSVYALARTTGFGPGAAFAAQVVAAMIALALAAHLAVSDLAPRVTLGLTLMLGLLVSPYACDYDLPMLGAAFAHLLPSLAASASALEQALIVALAWSASFWDFAMQRFYQYQGADLTPASGAPSLGGLFMLLLVALVMRAATRERTPRREQSAPALT